MGTLARISTHKHTHARIRTRAKGVRLHSACPHKDGAFSVSRDLTHAHMPALAVYGGQRGWGPQVRTRIAN